MSNVKCETSGELWNLRADMRGDVPTAVLGSLLEEVAFTLRSAGLTESDIGYLFREWVVGSDLLGSGAWPYHFLLM